jgi:hypothetical protein
MLCRSHNLLTIPLRAPVRQTEASKMLLQLFWPDRPSTESCSAQRSPDIVSGRGQASGARKAKALARFLQELADATG